MVDDREVGVEWEWDMLKEGRAGPNDVLDRALMLQGGS